MLDRSFRQFGAAAGLPPRFSDAVIAVPRDRFVHRFRVGDGALLDRDADPAGTLPLIYSDEVMRHVGPHGELLPSSNSQPSYILFLLQLLDLAAGHRVLEIGSGSGWLAAVMAKLVGPAGRVSGVELLPDLAAQSRTDLASLAIGNLEVVTGDGAFGHPGGAPFDRAIITAATWDLPVALFDQVAPGGRILVPVELRSGDGCDVTVLQHRGDAFVAERAVPGWFVPLQGAQQTRGAALETPPRGDPEARCGLPLGMLGPHGPMPVAAQFRAFLGRTEPGFVSLPSTRSMAQGGKLPPFGIADPEDGSLALWQSGEIARHGGPRAAKRLARAYASWAELGLPGLAAFQLEIHRAEAAPSATETQWVEARGKTALVWRVKRDRPSWRALLDG